MKTRPVTVFEYERLPSGVFKHPLNRVEKCEGTFHEFGVCYEEFETGAGNFSIAIVELPNGEIINPPVELIRFDEAPGESDDRT